MRILLALAIIHSLSGYASAQTSTPKSGKPLKQATPSTSTGCKLVGTVKGTKIWSGDCVTAPELRGAAPSAEPATPPDANPPAGKQ
jgi:hypothetical protein